MTEDIPKLHFIPRERLELWREANVRHSEALLNIEELAGSIKKHGVLVPLLVKEEEPRKKYLVFSGQRRFEACRIAELPEVPCFVFKDISVRDAKILSFSENLFREAMTAEDKSRAAIELFNKFKDMDRVGLALGVKGTTVRTYLKYGDIPDELRKFAKKGEGNLSPSQVEDIYIKFPKDMDKAVSIAKELNSLKKGSVQRRKFHEAIRKSVQSDDVKTVTERAEKLGRMKKFTILLPDSESKTLEKISLSRRTTIEDFIVEIVENWIREYLSGRPR